MDAVYSEYCLLQFHWEPSKFLNLNQYEKASVIAFIEHDRDNRRKQEREQERKMKKKGGKK